MDSDIIRQNKNDEFVNNSTYVNNNNNNNKNKVEIFRPENSNEEKEEKKKNCVMMFIEERGVKLKLKVNLDTGNTLKYPVVSTHILDDLVQIGLLSKLYKLKFAPIQVKGPDGRHLSVKGVLDFKIPIKTNLGKYLPFTQYYVLDNLVNDMNFGIQSMRALSCKWTFDLEKIIILGEEMKLLETVCNTDDGQVEIIVEEEKINNIKCQLGTENVLDLFSCEQILIPSKTVKYIKLINKEGTFQTDKDVIIIANNEFENKKMVISNPICLCRNNNLVIAVVNFFDSSIRIKKGEKIAYGISCDDNIQNLANQQERDWNDNNDRNEKYIDKGYINTIMKEEVKDRKYENQWDKQHFETPMKEREAYLMEKLDIKNNKLIREAKIEEKVLTLLLRYWCLFDITGLRIGKINSDIKHKITIEKGTEPIRQRPRPLNPIIEKKVKTQFENWERRGIVRKSNSPWSSPLVCILKKSGKLRIVADYRKLNSVSIKDSFPLPSINASLASLARQAVFSIVDSVDAFFSVPMEEESIQYTAVATPFSLYEWLKCPQGLCNAPSTYARVVYNALNHLSPEIAIVFQDDCCVVSKTCLEHLDNLEKVFQAYEKAGFILQINKCKIFQESVDFLGYRISREGLGTIPQYIKAIQKIEYPKTRKQVKAILGKFGYYRKHINNYTAIVKPLSDLLKGETIEKGQNEKINCPEDAKQAINIMKKKLTSAPILGFPDWKSNEMFRLYTDASKDCLAAIVTQKQRNKKGELVERTLLYDSKKTNNAQSHYPSNKLELLAVIWATETHKFLFFGRKFILITDHSALKQIRTMKCPKTLICRWLDMLSNFDFTVEHRAGKLIQHVDFLSRNNNPVRRADDETKEEETTCYLNSIILRYGDIEDTNWRELQDEDSSLRILRRWLENDELPNKHQLKLYSIELQRYAKIFDRLHIEDQNGILIRKTLEGENIEWSEKRILLPSGGIKIALAHYHSNPAAGHLGINATMKRLLNNFYHTRPTNITSKFIANCLECSRKRNTIGGNRKTQRNVMRSTQARYCMEIIYLDTFGPLHTTEDGYKYILTAKCGYSRYVWLLPMKNQNTDTILGEIERHIFAYFGLPDKIISDNYVSFTAEKMKDLCKKLNITFKQTTPYSPQSNSVEVTHRTMGQIFRAFEKQSKTDWKKLVPAMNLAINSMVNRITKHSPMFLMLGRPPRLERNILYTYHTDDEDITKRAMDRVEIMEKVFEEVNKNVETHLEYRIREYLEDDAKNFQEGKNVLVFFHTKGKPGISRKLQPAWSLPFKIQKRISPTTYELISLNWSKKPIKLLRSLSSIKLYEGSKTDFTGQENDYDEQEFYEQHEFEDINSASNIEQGPGYQPESTVERIRLKTGTWINRDVLTKKSIPTSEYDNDDGSEEIIDDNEVDKSRNDGTEELRYDKIEGARRSQRLLDKNVKK